jgi:hypothetical protein
MMRRAIARVSTRRSSRDSVSCPIVSSALRSAQDDRAVERSAPRFATRQRTPAVEVVQIWMPAPLLGCAAQ